MSTQRRPLLGVPVRGRGRPRVLSPLDQRVTLTVTSRERAQATLEAAQIEGKTSLAELIRRRSTASIDLVAWKEAAIDASDRLQAETNERDLLRRQISQANREIERSRAGRASAEDVASLEKSRNDFKARYDLLGRDSQKRESRLVGRLSYYDREDVAWKASRLGLTISDYMRMLVFDLVPGQSDRHLSALTRKRFYENVVQVARNGWGTPPSGDVCQNCRTPIER